MKSLFKKLNVAAAILFSIGILLTTFNLYNLPKALEKVSGQVDLTIIREISPVLSHTYFIVGITLILGLCYLVFTLYLMSLSKDAETVAQAEQSEARKEDEKLQEENSQKDDLAKRVDAIREGAKTIKDTKEKYEKVLSSLCMNIDASQGILYSVHKERNKRYIELYTSFAYNLPDSKSVRYEFGEGLAGQVAKECKKINISDVPEGYITIVSGLGAASPKHLAILPILEGDKVIMIAEIASFKEITPEEEELITEKLEAPAKKASDKPKAVKGAQNQKKSKA
jgi:hypothetical protein